MLRHKSVLFIIIIGILLALYSVVKHFSSAFPILNLEISMDRDQAITKAAEYHQLLAPEQSTYSTAVVFTNNEFNQTFIELEGGGKEVLEKLIRDDIYHPFYWQVRHFNPKIIDEISIYFTPTGRFSGFLRTIPETVTSQNISQHEALDLIHTFASYHAFPFAKYQLESSSQTTTSSGRLNHTFTFSCADIDIGSEGKLQIIAHVSGDKVTQFYPSLKIQESFMNRYANMRSFNNNLAAIALVFIILIYGFLGVLYGLWFLYRNSIVLWQQSYICGLIIALGIVLTQLNQLSQTMVFYNTAQSFWTFISFILFSLIIMLLATSCIFASIIAAAEGLSRKAFPYHVQLWNSANKDVAPSIRIASYVFGGYAIAAVLFIFVIVLYFYTTRFFGWWTPASSLVNPNILAHYIPWVSPLANSLQAGFIEECLFRAIPLAGAALIGERLGKRNTFIFIAFILQIFVFGAAHANYPAQPFYARMIELIIPSTIFGLAYLWYGLIPSIIAHVTYDIVWFAIPLFVANGFSAHINQFMIVILTLLPVWIILFRRYQKGGWINDISYAENKNFDDHIDSEKITEHRTQTILFKPRYHRYISYGLCIIGIAFCGLFFKAQSPFYSLKITKNEAINIALQSDPAFAQFVEKKGAKIIASTQHNTDLPHLFIWNKKGQENYKLLLQKAYLSGPEWTIRGALFEGTLIDRAEGWNLWINNNGDITRIKHTIPPSIAGAHLSQTEAIERAKNHAKKVFNLTETALVLKDAQATKQNDRTDWIITFLHQEDLTVLIKNNLKENLEENSELCITVSLAGDKIVDMSKYVKQPESWTREYTQDSLMLNLFRGIVFLLLSVIAGYGALQLIKTTNLMFLSNKSFWIIWTCLSSFSFLATIFQLPATQFYFTTTQSYQVQTIFSLLFNALSSTLAMFLLVLILTLVFIHLQKNRMTKTTHNTILHDVHAGIFGLGYLYGLMYLLPPGIPPLLHIAPAQSMSPLFSAIWMSLVGYLWIIGLACFLLIVYKDLVDNGKLNLLLHTLFICIVSSTYGLFLYNAITLSGCLIFAALCIPLIIILYQVYLRYDYTSAISIVTILYLGITLTKDISLNPFVHASYYFIVTYFIIALIGFVFRWYLGNREMLPKNPFFLPEKE